MQILLFCRTRWMRGRRRGHRSSLSEQFYTPQRRLVPKAKWCLAQDGFCGVTVNVPWTNLSKSHHYFWLLFLPELQTMSRFCVCIPWHKVNYLGNKVIILFLSVRTILHSKMLPGTKSQMERAQLILRSCKLWIFGFWFSCTMLQFQSWSMIIFVESWTLIFRFYSL